MIPERPESRASHRFVPMQGGVIAARLDNCRFPDSATRAALALWELTGPLAFSRARAYRWGRCGRAGGPGIP